jgi:iron complex outermembrane receptor protein
MRQHVGKRKLLPQTACKLNWYSQFSDQFSLYTTAYWSGGKGGGTGTYGSMGWDYTNRQRVVDWQSTYERNINNTMLI